MLTRRRFLAISAVAAALPLSARAGEPMHIWKGSALGAHATIRLAHPDAEAIAGRAAAEIERLENVFSLYRSNSDLSRLNAEGRLEAPSFDLLECLSLSGSVHRASDGRFDPTVQPLWAAHAEAAVAGLPLTAAARARVLALTGWGKLRLDPQAIVLQPGMALTLNGIAQGYIADRVADLLAAEGLDDILIDTGEMRAVGSQPDGSPWPVRLAQGGSVALAGRSLATSAPLGTTFDDAGTMSHILDPRTGEPALPVWEAVSISAPSAALADGLSTSACLMNVKSHVLQLCRRFPGVRLEALKPA